MNDHEPIDPKCPIVSRYKVVVDAKIEGGGKVPLALKERDVPTDSDQRRDDVRDVAYR